MPKNSFFEFFILLLKYAVKWFSVHYNASNSTKTKLLGIKIKSISCHVHTIKLRGTLKHKLKGKRKLCFSIKFQNAPEKWIWSYHNFLCNWIFTQRKISNWGNWEWYEYKYRYILNLLSQGVLKNIFLLTWPIWLYPRFLWFIFSSSEGTLVPSLEQQNASSWPRTIFLGKFQPLLGEAIYGELEGKNEREQKWQEQNEVMPSLSWFTMLLSRNRRQLRKEQHGLLSFSEQNGLKLD